MNLDRPDYTEIFQNTGFLHIAAAIRACTVNLRWWKDVKGKDSGFKVRHGLGQDLLRHAHARDRFIEELYRFVFDYSRESSNVRAVTREKRPFVTVADVERFLDLFDRYDSAVIATLLVAVGYVSDYEAPEEDSADSEMGELHA